MKNVEVNPHEKFKYLIKGSATARNLTFLYMVVSFTLAFKMRAHIEYVIPLIIGALLLFWYTLTHLNLKNFSVKKRDLPHQLIMYRDHLLKRERYESSVVFIWYLTIVPVVLFEKEISVNTVILFMIAIYLVIVFGGYLFKKAENELIKLELYVESN